MALALQLLVYPLTLLIAIIIVRMADGHSIGTFALGLSLVALVAGVGYGVFRFTFRLDRESGVDKAPDQVDGAPDPSDTH